MGLYQSENNRPIGLDAERVKFNDQVVLSEASPEFLVDKGVFMLEYLLANTGETVTLIDGKDRTIVSGISEFSNDHSPLRCNYGIKITGNVVIAKGYVVRNIFSE